MTIYLVTLQILTIRYVDNNIRFPLTKLQVQHRLCEPGRHSPLANRTFNNSQIRKLLTYGKGRIVSINKFIECWFRMLQHASLSDFFPADSERKEKLLNAHKASPQAFAVCHGVDEFSFLFVPHNFALETKTLNF